MNRICRKSEAGFTLIELTTVVAILGILVALITPMFKNYLIKTKVTELDSVAYGAKHSIEDYARFKEKLPESENDVDLNRAFATSGQESEPEIDVVKPFFEKTSFDLVLDLHSALPKREGYFVLHRSTLKLLGPAMENFGKAWPVLSNGSKPYKEEAPGICTSAPKGTLKDYLADQGCPHVITLEAPRALEFNERTKGLSRLAGSIIDEFAAQNKAVDSH